MARKHRLEYLKRKKARERAKEQARKLKQEQKQQKLGLQNLEQKKLEQQVPEFTGEKEPNFWKEILGWVLYIAIIIGATYFIVTFVGQRTRVSGDSMESSLHNGDNLIVDKISYRFRDPERYEIIVFPYQYQENTFYIKRIIGLPGETVQVKDGEVYINGKLLGENYGLEQIEEGKEGLAMEPITLGKDEYFVLGDNRNHSSDSRDPSVGVLTRDDLIGRAWVRIWPLNSIGVIPHE